MQRFIARASQLYRFSRVVIQEGTREDTTNMDKVSDMPFYRSFREGLHLTINNKLEEANVSFQTALNEL